jgi:hypothetical protein
MTDATREFRAITGGQTLPAMAVDAYLAELDRLIARTTTSSRTR